MEKKIFNDTKRAFALKTDEDLKHSIFIFKMMSHSWMVAVGTWLTKMGLKLHLPIKGLIKDTIFRQFCGGESQEECLPVIEKMNEMRVCSVFDYASEIRIRPDKTFDKDLKNLLQIAEFAAKHKQEIPFVVIKPTNVGSFEIWEKVNAEKTLNAEEAEAWKNIQQRVDVICNRVKELGLKLLVDAEESWIQTAADNLVEKMMERYNKEKAIVYNTAQCYRWDRLQYMKDLHKKAQERGFKVGMKMVRGAYMEKENDRAKKLGYPTPICEDKEATDVNYNHVVNYCLENIEDIAIYIGSHNEVSAYLAIHFMDKLGIHRNDERVWFSQLYGMSDNITFNLAMEGYNAAKYLPFGKVDEVIPYLIRRAQENSSVKGQTGRELALLLEEQNRRRGTYVKRVL